MVCHGFLSFAVRSVCSDLVKAVAISATGLLFAAGSAGTHALADAVSIDSFGTISSIHQSASSGQLTLTIRDLAPTTPASMGGWSIGLAAVPLGGATGSVSITAIAYPVGGGIFTVPFPAGSPTINANTPFAGAVNVNASNNSFTGVPVPSTPTGLFQFTLTASANASGLFSLQLVDSYTGPVTSPDDLTDTLWNDADAGFAQQAFLVDGNPFQSGAEIGQLQVVPEPSSLVVALGGIVVGLSFMRRQLAPRLRRTKAASALGPQQGPRR